MLWCFTYVEKLDLVLVPFFLVNIYITMVMCLFEIFLLTSLLFSLCRAIHHFVSGNWRLGQSNCEQEIMPLKHQGIPMVI